jgi:hypothetical protein
MYKPKHSGQLVLGDLIPGADATPPRVITGADQLETVADGQVLDLLGDYLIQWDEVGRGIGSD